MKACYVPFAYEDWDSGGERQTISIYEDDTTPEKTGLLDVNGTPLYRVRDRVPFGFRGRG